MKLYTLCLLLAITVEQICAKKWWETASFYQIYPRSFKDSDGDGVGDLKGITEKLAYLKEIGITATWLSPIFTSPMADFGYDIADFYAIDPLFGSMQDFEQLLEKANEIGIKIILDFVPNHSSDECEWFIKSAANDSTYKDYYVWHPGKFVDGVRQPPNNWISVFRGPAWTWHEGRQAYYLHQFHAKQPDFNYRNPQVREMMKEVLRFWLRKGAAGFRVDAVPHVFEVEPDENGDYPDEPRNWDVEDPESYDYLQHNYTVNQPETLHLIYEFRSVLDEITAELGGDERILMTEAYSPLDVIMQYYGNATAEGSQIPFNFELISYMSNSTTAAQLEALINNWLDAMPAGRTANWVLGNHDRNRIGSRFGTDRIDLFNILLSTLPGVSVTYNGEEIGMTDVWLSWEDTVDPQGCQSSPEEYESLSRDPARTPFQWNEEPFAGFTAGTSTWLPVSTNYATLNVKRQRGISLSHLNIFKELRSLRELTVFRNGATQVKALTHDILGIARYYRGNHAYVVLLNLENRAEIVNLHARSPTLTDEMEYVLVTSRSAKLKGAKVKTNSITVLPYEAVVLRTTAAINTRTKLFND